MTAAPSPCLTGCTVRGQHRTTCETRDAKVDPCKGCLPRDAETGLLCAWCFQRLQSDVATAPALVTHLREIGEPAAHAAPPSDWFDPSDPAWGNVLPAAWGAADEIHGNLASWALLILEKHSLGASMVGPDEVGAWHTRYGTTVGVTPDKGGRVRNGGPRLFEERVGVAPEHDRLGEPIVYTQWVQLPDPPRIQEATVRLCAWLRPLLLWCAEQEWAAEMRRDLGSLIATTSARWPMQDSKARAVVGVRCARCGFESLDYTPTKGADLPFDVRCVNPECGRIYTESEWDAVLARMTVERGYVA